jgi:hypothetical protein
MLCSNDRNCCVYNTKYSTVIDRNEYGTECYVLMDRNCCVYNTKNSTVIDSNMTQNVMF